MHDLQLFDTTFMEISGGPVRLHPPPFSGVQNYKFNKLTIFSAYHTNSLVHLRRALYMECTLALKCLIAGGLETSEEINKQGVGISGG